VFARHTPPHGSGLQHCLDRSDRARMAAEVQVFIAALECDLIDAANFARH
jgi:hypothetical protein